jgi:16S rRNA (cytidine1402-2'-O)-methyltransferase
MFTSVNKFNENSKISKILLALKSGINVTLISDAGTPCISDPGYSLVNACLKNGIKIESLIGPSSVELALEYSGFTRERFFFQGFLPKKKIARDQALNSIKQKGLTSIFYENKNRILKTLRSIEEIFGEDQDVYIGVEMTKMFERNLKGAVSDLYDAINENPDFTMPSFKGELTVVIGPAVV